MLVSSLFKMGIKWNGETKSIYLGEGDVDAQFGSEGFRLLEAAGDDPPHVGVVVGDVAMAVEIHRRETVVRRLGDDDQLAGALNQIRLSADIVVFIPAQPPVDAV